AAWAVGAAALDLALIACGLPAFPCPTRTLGFTCPGCGLGRACVALLRGDFQEMLRLHAFAPLAVVGLALAALVAVLPTSRVARISDAVSRVVPTKRLSVAVGAALVIYWIVRATSGGGVAVGAAAT